jgi:hypothetical protein
MPCSLLPPNAATGGHVSSGPQGSPNTAIACTTCHWVKTPISPSQAAHADRTTTAAEPLCYGPAELVPACSPLTAAVDVIAR